jgi:hypothetical protein
MKFFNLIPHFPLCHFVLFHFVFYFYVNRYKHANENMKLIIYFSFIIIQFKKLDTIFIILVLPHDQK